MSRIRLLAALSLLTVVVACAPQSFPTQQQPAATPIAVPREVAVQALADLPEPPAAVAASVNATGMLEVSLPNGSARTLGQGGATLLTRDADHVVWAEPCAACAPAVAAQQRGLHVYTVSADRDVLLLAERLPRFNEVLLGGGWLAVLLPSTEHANAAALQVFDLRTGESRTLSDRALAIGGAMQPSLALQDERVAWVDAPGTTGDLALRVVTLDTGMDIVAPTPLDQPRALVVSRDLVAWRDDSTWRGLDLADGSAWAAPLAPADVPATSIRAVGVPQLLDRRLIWTLDTSAGTQAFAADVP